MQSASVLHPSDGEPRRTSTALPVMLPGAGALMQPSPSVVGVPVFAIARLPLSGGGGGTGPGVAVPGFQPILEPSGVMVNAGCAIMVLSIDAAPIALRPAPGVPFDQTGPPP